jgi:mono/diheme cytochrome c family protein
VFALAQQNEIKRVPIARTSASSGHEMYATYCAACHGKEGRGNGPAAEALKVPPADLTALAKKNEGKYPSDHVSSTIKGDLEMPAHGSREMPVWGNLFWQLSQGHTSEVQLRVSNLNTYIESLQEK